MPCTRQDNPKLQRDWGGGDGLKMLMSRAKSTPFYEWHHWIRAQLRDLGPAKAVDPEDEALLSGELIGVGSLSDKDVGALLAGEGEVGEGQVPDGTLQRPAPSSRSTPKSKRAILMEDRRKE